MRVLSTLQSTLREERGGKLGVTAGKHASAAATTAPGPAHWRRAAVPPAAGRWRPAAAVAGLFLPACRAMLSCLVP